jgi:hypothetical protein
VTFIKEREADATAKDADAQRRVAEATTAANLATLHKRNDAIARAERRLREAEAAKTEAEADAIRLRAETERLTAVAKAKAEPLKAVSPLTQDGGELFVNRDNLEEILRLELPSAESSAEG